MTVNPVAPQWRDARLRGARVMLVGVERADADFLRAMLNTLGVAAIVEQADLEEAVRAESHLRCDLALVAAGVVPETADPTLLALREQGARVCLLHAGEQHRLVKGDRVDGYLEPPFLAGSLATVLSAERRDLSAA